MAKLTFIFSSMNSGKSLSLLTKNYMLREKGFKTLLLKPKLDTRDTNITTRIGLSASCFVIDTLASLVVENLDEKPDYILVDEAQFLTTEQVWDLAHIVDYLGITVICYGLKLHWQGDFFEGSRELLKIADEVEQLETLCKVNRGAPALFHIKTGGTDNPIEPGYDDLYSTASRRVWKEWYEQITHKSRTI
jgi:thymidine kinase